MNKNMISSENLDQIKSLGMEIDHQMAFGGKSKGNQHLCRVVKIADYLAESAQADKLIVEAGAWLHDTALPSGDDYDYQKNKVIVKDILKSVPISAEVIELIAECVASHEGTQVPKTLEAKVVHDADVIEKLGLLGLIRHTWKMTNSGKIKPESIRDEDVKDILRHIAWRRHRLQTPEAKRLGEILSLDIQIEDAKKIVKFASGLAIKGIITEEISSRLYKNLSSEQESMLKSQLGLGYLISK